MRTSDQALDAIFDDIKRCECDERWQSVDCPIHGANARAELEREMEIDESAIPSHYHGMSDDWEARRDYENDLL